MSLNIQKIEDIHHHPDSGIFTSSLYDDDFGGTVTNLAPSIVVDSIPTKRVNTIHPQSQILGDLTSPVQTRAYARKRLQQFDNQGSMEVIPLQLGKLLFGQLVLINKRDAGYSCYGISQLLDLPRILPIIWDLWYINGCQSAFYLDRFPMYLTASRTDIQYASCVAWTCWFLMVIETQQTGGFCQFLGRRLISWQCKKQTIVATSSTEAEYVAAANWMDNMGYPTEGKLDLHQISSHLNGGSLSTHHASVSVRLQSVVVGSSWEGYYVDVEEYEPGDLDEPRNYKAALADPKSDKWLEAMNTKMQSMKDNQVWYLVDLPSNGRIVGCKWLFKKKTDMDGNVHTFKAHLVAKGFTQTYRVDYGETFSPVTYIRAIRILLAITTFYDYEI
ncbi:putative retrotransposon ty1-copia subclass protein [Tanacetum coccineum]